MGKGGKVILEQVIYCSRILKILLIIEGFIRDMEIARPNEHDLTAKNKIPVMMRNYTN